MELCAKFRLLHFFCYVQRHHDIEPKVMSQRSLCVLFSCPLFSGQADHAIVLMHGDDAMVPKAFFFLPAFGTSGHLLFHNK